jgi:D-2-hydroxyglutarate dehydrogenase
VLLVAAGATYKYDLSMPTQQMYVLLVAAGATYKYDLSMPTQQMYELVEDVRQRVQHFPDVMVVGYGHVGDGNLHLNVSSPKGYNSELENVLEPYVYEWTAQQAGSISAEHGIGRMKAAALRYSKSNEAVDLMQRLKLLFDPHRILNPYKVLPDARHLGEVERY